MKKLIRLWEDLIVSGNCFEKDKLRGVFFDGGSIYDCL